MLRISHHRKVCTGVLGRGRSWCKGPGVGLILVSHKQLKTHKPRAAGFPEAVVLTEWVLCPWGPHGPLALDHRQGEADLPSPRGCEHPEGALGAMLTAGLTRACNPGPGGADGGLLWRRGFLSGSQITGSRGRDLELAWDSAGP